MQVFVCLGSAAASAGVLIGDKLISVDNVNVVDASLETIRQLIPNSKSSTLISSRYDTIRHTITGPPTRSVGKPD